MHRTLNASAFRSAGRILPIGVAAGCLSDVYRVYQLLTMSEKMKCGKFKRTQLNKTRRNRFRKECRERNCKTE